MERKRRGRGKGGNKMGLRMEAEKGSEWCRRRRFAGRRILNIFGGVGNERYAR